MAAQFDSWESYFYPETYDPRTGQGVMRNLREWRSAEALSSYEYRMTGARQRQLLAQPGLIARTFDAAHVRAIHRHLFQDVYEWAGAFRGVNMAKGSGRGFGDVKTGEVERYLGDVHRLVTGTTWAELDREQFGECAASVFAYLNQAHPFREGNGRTSKVFMEHVAERSRFTFDYERVTPFEWNQASEFSRPDLYSYDPVPDSLVPVFRHIAVERPTTPELEMTDQAAQVRSLYSASYPRPATPGRSTGPQSGTERPRRTGPGLPGQGYTTGRGDGR